jgi:hypothetical protein
LLTENRFSIYPMRYIGVDPGISGGIAAIHADGSVFGALKMPATDEGRVEAVQIMLDGASVAVAGIEHVHGGVWAPGGRRQGSTSAFTFGGAYHSIRTAFLAANVRVVDVRPLRWQTQMRCRTGGDKNISKARALELFPSMKVTHALADALILAEWVRRYGLSPQQESPSNGEENEEAREG